MNDIIKQIIPKDYSSFVLIDSSFLINLDKYEFLYEHNTFLKQHPDFPVSLTQKVIDSSILSWKSFNLDKAKIYSHENLPRAQSGTICIQRIASQNMCQRQIDSLNNVSPSNTVYAKIKSNWSEEKATRAWEKAWNRSNKLIVKENRSYFSFSTPVFSLDIKYAIVRVRRNGSAITYIMKKTENEWKKIYEYGLSQS